MSKRLLQQFLDEDADSYVRQNLLAAISYGKSSKARFLQEFSFNRFNVSLNFGEGEVVVDDEWTPVPSRNADYP